MQVKYIGPMDAVRVGEYGKHEKGEIKDYPPDFAKQLLATSSKQQFELVGEPAPEAKERKDAKKK